MAEVYNLEIVVYDFKIEPSKKKTGNLLTLQIELEGIRRVIFTGSTVLQQMITEVAKEKFPFRTKIVKRGEYPEFT